MDERDRARGFLEAGDTQACAAVITRLVAGGSAHSEDAHLLAACGLGEHFEALSREMAMQQPGRAWHIDDFAALAPSERTGKRLILARLAATLRAFCDVNDAQVATYAQPKTALQGPAVDMFLRLADQAIGAPDYDKTGAGWFHARSRLDYRTHNHSRFVRLASEERQRMTSDSLRESLAECTSLAQVEALTCDVFARELGVRPTFLTACELIEAESFVPLRALKASEIAEQVIDHIVGGDFEAWRYDNRVGRRQLDGLSAEQREIWISPSETEESVCADGLDLLWVAKIGGPSHGFDYMPECTLPLLANARSRAIVAGGGIARAYLRLLFLENGAPILYLEPVQHGFGYAGKNYASVILAHAIGLASAMRVPLSNPLRGTVRAERYLLRASNGIYEASDTLSDKHHWEQREDELTGVIQRFVINP